MKNDSVDIVLATYEGETYIDDLINSIFLQDYTPFRVYARDDGSTDNTFNKLKKYAEQFTQFTVIENQEHIGIIKNFEQLLQLTKSDYILLADQDDYWFSDKISRSIRGIRKIESQFGSDTPALFFTDLQIVDQNLLKIADSFWQYKNLDPEISQVLHKLIVRNVCPGCSMIINRALLEKTLPFPNGIIMHDWWLILSALVLGKVAYSDTPTISYRQHGKNSIGAKKKSINQKIYNLLFRYRDMIDEKNQTQYQAKLLLDQYSTNMKKEDLQILKAYSNYRIESKIMHKYRCYKNGISTKGVLGNIGLYLLL